MLKVAALAYLPIATVLLGLLVLGITAVPKVMRGFEAATALYHGAAVLSLLLTFPVAWLVARRMLTRREKSGRSACSTPTPAPVAEGPSSRRRAPNEASASPGLSCRPASTHGCVQR